MKNTKRVASLSDVRIGVESTFVSYQGSDGRPWFAVTYRGKLWAQPQTTTEHFNYDGFLNAAELWEKLMVDYAAEVTAVNRTLLRKKAWVFRSSKEVDAQLVHDTILMATLSEQRPPCAAKKKAVWTIVGQWLSIKDTFWGFFVPRDDKLSVSLDPKTTLVDPEDMDDVLRGAWGSIVNEYCKALEHARTN